MNKEEIIRMAREAGMNLLTDKEIDAVSLEIMGFAVLDKEQNETARMIARAIETAVLEKLGKVDVEPVHQFRHEHCADWYDGLPDHGDGGGPYETRTLYPASALAALQQEIEMLKAEKMLDYTSLYDKYSDALAEVQELHAKLEQAQAELGQLPEIQAMLMTENKKMRGALMIAAAALKHSSPNRESVNALEQHNAAIDVIITALETKT